MEEEIVSDNITTGTVVQSSGGGVIVSINGENYFCSLRGSLKQKKTHYKNLICVGDKVDVILHEDKGSITKIYPRKSELTRSDNLSRRRIQLIAVNIDYVFITVSVVAPRLKPSLIDRYIIAARNGNMKPVVIFNKIDLLKDCSEEEPLLLECQRILKEYDVPYIEMSTQTGLGFDKMKSFMAGKTSVFSGQSGVGKSTIINHLLNIDLTTGEIVEKTKKGAHTTTHASLIKLDNGGFCIDTPGIKSFGVWNLDVQDLRHHFTKISQLGRGCKYPNCYHLNEPDCKVKDGLINGEISEVNYDSYISLLHEIEEQHKPR